MSNYIKCKSCKGTGKVDNKVCKSCEGLGVPITTNLEEQFHDASSFDDTQIFSDEDNFIDFEEEDYEI